MSTPPEARPRPSRRVLWCLLVPIIALSIAGTLADWFGAAIITEHPLLQMFLNPRNRYLALASNEVDTVPYYAVGFFRLILTDPLFYLLGYFYGDTALRWIERKIEDKSGFVKRFEKFFAKAAGPIVLLMPNGYICAMAGATGMRPRVFVTLNVIGTMGRLIIIRQTAAAFEGPLDAVMRFIQRYQWWIVAFSVALGAIQLLQQRKKGTSEIESLSSIEAQLESPAPEPEPAADGDEGHA